MEWHCFCDSILILIYWIQTHDLKSDEKHLHLSMNSALLTGNMYPDGLCLGTSIVGCYTHVLAIVSCVKLIDM